MTAESSVLVTTSRRPSRRTRTFCKDFSHVFPRLISTNRGKLSLDGVAEKALHLNVEKVALVSRWKGDPGKIQLFRISKAGLSQVPPLIYVKDVKLSRDFNGNMPRKRGISSLGLAAPQKTSSELKRFADVLSDFFDVSLLPLGEIYDDTFDAVLHLSFDTSTGIVLVFKIIPGLVEVGPQISISHLVWELN